MFTGALKVPFFFLSAPSFMTKLARTVSKQLNPIYLVIFFSCFICEQIPTTLSLRGIISEVILYVSLNTSM